MWASRLADFCLVVHFAWVFYVVMLVPVIIIGWILRWSWVRNSWVRNLHIAMIGLVVLETVLEIECPLTKWERQLRAVDGVSIDERGCIQQWMRTIMFVSVSTEDLAISYFAFGSAIVLLYIAVPPRWLEKKIASRAAARKVDEGASDVEVKNDAGDVDKSGDERT